VIGRFVCIDMDNSGRQGRVRWRIRLGLSRPPREKPAPRALMQHEVAALDKAAGVGAQR
jgi:hypothetical protein